jgi:hypothetical protein
MEDNIKIDFYGNRDGGCGLDSSGSEMDRWKALVNTVMNLQIP